ncbi:hypothetical protein STSU_014245 [Streptomyces tsukubensis NRRL18488]|uniref:Uncharacterized protein n=1 Tax=Streptomyces tsukubensis (strain DSM 42081 / NBRC 108919 / NRRL 18488 / 9993) TaxID=1114943 RepID=A0A7G3UGD9_STRT9|nr:hypothetical protein STSU_014245 [Streptomyces tsukubensis NRRL18488]
MWVRHLVTKSMAWEISFSQSAGVQRATEREPSPQKWPLKWVPISWPSSHACRSSFRVSLIWASVR